jgi:hypothetical protein
MLQGSFRKHFHTQQIILKNSIQRDLPVGQCATLLEILWHEHSLTSEQLIAAAQQFT